MAGINELEDLVRFTAAVGNGIGTSLEDGKITFGDAVNFVPALTKLPAAFTGIENVPEEFKDLDEAERQSLVDLAKNEFNVPGDKAEAFVEETFELGTLIGAYINKHFIK